MNKITLLFLCFTFMLTSCFQSQENSTQIQPETPTSPIHQSTQTNEAIEESDPILFTGKKIPLIYSHDGAPDDIATLVYLSKHPGINLIGVIQSYGEQHPSKSLDEWQIFLYDVIDYDSAPIGVGSEESVDPAHNEFPSSWRTNADKFWGQDLPEPSGKFPSEDGVDLLIELIQNSSEKVTLLVTGAQTDVALALEKDPSIKNNIEQIVIMGGAFNVDGNLGQPLSETRNNTAEWNIFADPLAAQIVFTSGVHLSIVPLDGSDDFTISRIDHAKIHDSEDYAVSLLADFWEDIFSWWGGNFQIWDIVAAIALTNPEHFEWTYDGVDVITEPGSNHGQTFQLKNNSEITRFATDTDYSAVRKTLFAVLSIGGNK